MATLIWLLWWICECGEKEVIYWILLVGLALRVLLLALRVISPALLAIIVLFPRSKRMMTLELSVLIKAIALPRC